mmetsp:Transcript_16355/g.28689  ORF Transcript_16355/g.28689 Transcript_16355/m.28689 type:complete len:220 (+) Transcript_16355:51-710(+)|eukprot:CAMPEP_0197622678 /NCGR_PEP_ID=MMETSP1338-20131121/2878_1 /TAXON_ID=43686 ORGANISM="Pelagodinium beii, Strain RCC1491" /NCGR_SAMPLE_ID=MMETSP1338 /ASSEMBLY_ACC=CAM_ASM_000754 /LENGTH=219 /DNA_ID=CAMNT_0043192425 /DNA_START=48 /DNA_END=707 /DNA_ORIENTATION=-
MDGLSSGWTKAICIAGGAAATAGLLWYLLREGEEDESDMKVTTGADGEEMLFAVTDPKHAAIGIRAGPDVMSERTGFSLLPGQVFEVSEILPAEGGQMYLRLADGRGWAFTHSSRDGRLLCQPISKEEAARLPTSDTRPTSMESMMADINRLMETNPELRAQVMASPEVRAMMENPEALKTAAAQSPLVEEALRHQAGIGEALSDPASLAESLKQATGR